MSSFFMAPWRGSTPGSLHPATWCKKLLEWLPFFLRYLPGSWDHPLESPLQTVFTTVTRCYRTKRLFWSQMRWSSMKFLPAVTSIPMCAYTSYIVCFMSINSHRLSFPSFLFYSDTRPPPGADSSPKDNSTFSAVTVSFRHSLKFSDYMTWWQLKFSACFLFYFWKIFNFFYCNTVLLFLLYIDISTTGTWVPNLKPPPPPPPISSLWHTSWVPNSKHPVSCSWIQISDLLLTW